MKILYNRLLLVMVLVVASLVLLPLFIYPCLSAPDTVTNVMAAVAVLVYASALYLTFTKVIPKFCIKRCAGNGVL